MGTRGDSPRRFSWIQASSARPHREFRWIWGQVLGTFLRYGSRGEVHRGGQREVDLESGDVVSVGIRASRGEDESAGDVSVTLERETDQPDDRSIARSSSSMRPRMPVCAMFENVLLRRILRDERNSRVDLTGREPPWVTMRTAP